MKFLQEAFRNLHPLLQFTFILCIALVGMSVSVFISTFVNACLCDTPLDVAEYTKVLSTASTDAGVCGNLVMNSINQILAFMGAGFVYSKLVGGVGVGLKPKGAQAGFIRFLLGAIAITLAFAPFLDITYRLNEWILRGTSFHTYASGLEAQAMVLTKAMLDIGSFGELTACLIAVAVLPAIAEEYLFRGALQPLFAKWSGSIHLGVWCSAIVFSAIHMQFFGFIPRMLLGAGFGYLVVASGNLWVAVGAHFINNASAVIAAWYFGAEWLETGLEPSSEPWGIEQVVMTCLFGLFIILIARRLRGHSVWKENESNYLGLGQ